MWIWILTIKKNTLGILWHNLPHNYQNYICQKWQEQQIIIGQLSQYKYVLRQPCVSAAPLRWRPAIGRTWPSSRNAFETWTIIFYLVAICVDYNQIKFKGDMPECWSTIEVIDVLFNHLYYRNKGKRLNCLLHKAIKVLIKELKR